VADAMSYVARIENDLARDNLAHRTRDAQVDLQALGVDFHKLSEERLYGHADTGPFQFTDTSHSQARIRDLQLKTAKEQDSSELTMEVASLLSMPSSRQAVFDPRQPAHPDHALYTQIHGGMEQLNARQGRPWGESSDRTVASLLCDAKERGLTRVDHVLASEQRGSLQAGENLFLVQGRPDDPAHNRSCTKTAEAAQAPEPESLQRLDMINQKLTQEVAQPQIQQQANLESHTQGAPVR
jgi:hypothetical protein